MRLAEQKWLTDLLLAAAVYAVSAVPVLMGLTMASTPGILVHEEAIPEFFHVCNYFDGWFFRDITEYGYWVHEDKQSAIAFFPGQPLAAIFLTWLTGWPHLITLPLVSNAAFVVALALISALVRTRWPDQSIGTRVTVLAVLAFYPAGLYFRIAYSESLFLAVTALLLLGFVKRWPLLVLAFVAGASTGVRAVGVAGTAAVMVYILFDRERGPLGRRVLTAAALAPVACWGLLAFMAFQWSQFGTPFAFVNAQEHWKPTSHRRTTRCRRGSSSSSANRSGTPTSPAPRGTGGSSTATASRGWGRASGTRSRSCSRSSRWRSAGGAAG